MFVDFLDDFVEFLLDVVFELEFVSGVEMLRLV